MGGLPGLGGISSDSGDGEGPVTGSDTTIDDVTIDANRDYAAYLLDLDESQVLEGSGRPEVAESGTVTTTDEDGETTTETFFFTPDIYGTDGDNTITAQSTFSDLNIFAGEGDDKIILGDSFRGDAEGGAGDDIFILGQGSTVGEFTGGDGSDTFILDPRDDGNRDYFGITDFASGTDQIILELGEGFDKNWTSEFTPINSGIGTELRVTFPEDPDHNDIVIRFHYASNLTANDLSIVRAA
jgi:hypothetical protein